MPDVTHHFNEHPLSGRSGRIRTVLEIRGANAYFIYREVLWKDKTEWELFANKDGRIKLGPVEMLFLASIITQRVADSIVHRIQVSKVKNVAKHVRKAAVGV